MIDYYIANPAGNITALVIDNGISKQEYASISDEIMGKNKSVEQVGFVSFKDDRLQLNMAGGEFCGNAAISTAALYCHIYNKDVFDGLLAVSGAKDKAKVSVKRDNGQYNCSIIIDKPQSINNYDYSIDGTLYTLPTVALEGISHVIVKNGFNTDVAQKLLHKYAKEFNLSAMGVMIYDKATGKMTPIVYVRECNTCVFENSCASGSIALFAYLTQSNKEIKEISVIEPGGVLKVQLCDKAEYVKLCSNVIIEEHCKKEK